MECSEHSELSFNGRSICRWTAPDTSGGIQVRSGQFRCMDAAGDFITIAEPENGSDLLCFVATPFSEREQDHTAGFFTEALRQLIGPAGEKAGFRVVTARKQGSDVIHATIINGLTDADLVVATSQNIIQTCCLNPACAWQRTNLWRSFAPVEPNQSSTLTICFGSRNTIRVFGHRPLRLTCRRSKITFEPLGKAGATHKPT